MLNNRCLLPIYLSRDEQLRNKPYCKDKEDFRLKCYPDRLLPFRLHIEEDHSLDLRYIELVKAIDDTEHSSLYSHYYSSSVPEASPLSDNKGYVVSFDASSRKSASSIPPGDYYYKIELGGTTYYSEVFRVLDIRGRAAWLSQVFGQFKNYMKNGMSPEHIVSFLESSYFSGKHFEHNILLWSHLLPLGEMRYTDTYFEYLLLDYEPGESSYKNEEKGKNNANGDFIAESLGVTKSRQINGLFPEYLLDGLSTLLMHDIALLITRHGRIEYITGSDIKANWLDDGCLANTTLQLETTKEIYSISSIC